MYSFIGTQLNLISLLSLQMFGCGSVAQLVLSGGSHGMFLTVNFAFGFAATLGILVCGQISGKQTDLLMFMLCNMYLELFLFYFRQGCDFV